MISRDALHLFHYADDPATALGLLQATLTVEPEEDPRFHVLAHAARPSQLSDERGFKAAAPKPVPVPKGGAFVFAIQAQVPVVPVDPLRGRRVVQLRDDSVDVRLRNLRTSHDRFLFRRVAVRARKIV
jgi:hypothetical protein